MGQASSSQRAGTVRSNNNNHNRNQNSISSRSLSRLSREQHSGQPPGPLNHSLHRSHHSTGGIDIATQQNHAFPPLTPQTATSRFTTVALRPEMFRSSSDINLHSTRQEDNPMVSMDSLGPQNSSATLETPTSIPASVASRQSAMSRLGSRILPNSVVRGLLNSGEETPAEGRAHRIGLLSRTLHRSDPGHHSHRFSSFTGSSSRGISRRRSIRGPYPPIRGDATLLPDSPPNPTYIDATSMERDSGSGRFSWRHRARLSHVRHSIAVPISQIFGQPPPMADPIQPAVLPPRRPSRPSFTEGSDHMLPPLGSMDTHMEFGGPRELDSVEPSARNTLPSISSSTPSRPTRSASPARRHTPSRSRHIRSMRRDEQTPLSRVLQLAAAAIAAQLSGNAAPAMPNIQAIGADGADGSLESFIQSLQQATSAQTQGTATEDGLTGSQRDGGLPHVNFLRVFRFVNPENSEDSSATGQPNQPASENTQDSGSDRMDLDDHTPTDSGQDRRLVTLVVVGVRSVPSISNGLDNDAGLHARASLDSLLRLQFITPNDVSRTERGSSGFLRRADRRSRFSSHRRSMGGNTFPANYDSQRHQRSHTSTRSQSDLASSLPTVLSESPPGPHPPPSTPAEPGLSNVSSETNSPSRRPSASSAVLPQLNEDSSQEPDEPSEAHPLFNNVRQRRRSDSETARHRGLGSGAARRNGVVEPDGTSPSAGRSWLIYVVGTNLSENHPAFATPSLFTDNPTYEDMLLLSSLLGPAKPPVASQEDVASAGGILTLVEYGGSLIAESADATQKIPIAESERCLICLSDYEAAEEVRQLNKCQHIYIVNALTRSIPTNSVAVVVDHWTQLLPPMSGSRCVQLRKQRLKQHERAGDNFMTGETLLIHIALVSTII
ncbi:hypothetical protein ACJ72_04457 [Emergomyces africanus]|uniref:RING-type domain-containing protein n=1 Tax=Emergomyces africanus TaxID=1955775 RepID=A0A1B7NWP6_9EURO|nr:hypothetical protein ACJ72_04457 [Emergomyces africanus]